MRLSGSGRTCFNMATMDGLEAKRAGSAGSAATTEMQLVVVAMDALLVTRARALSLRLDAPLRVGAADGQADQLLLLVDDAGLRLKQADGSEVTVDVAALGKPRRGRDLLGRAIGLRAANVVDATAGLGADAFQLATAGHRVTMIERAPLVALLLEDALERARSGNFGAQAAAAAERVTLVSGDARHYLRQLPAGHAPDVILLDPMYPRRGKTALPAKGMALFRDLVGEDHDAAELLTVARSAALRRVVVKRPLRAPALGSSSPSGSLKGSTTRYDLYAPTSRPD